MAEPFASVINLGCRVNRVESDRISEDLLAHGFALVDADEADLIVINTCAVTGEAEAKTRKAVRQALGRPREPIVIATGCAANLHPEMLEELSSRVVVERLKTDVAQRAAALVGIDEGVHTLDPSEVAQELDRARLGIKVQDGCNNRCTYCIVWKARGAERSVPVEAVLERVRRAVQAGIPEVVLTGVNLGAYDGVSATDEHVEIDELLGRILAETAVSHVRLSSIEPMDVSDRLLDQMASDPRRVAPFLHLPVQAGSTRTLERMGRPYTADDFRALAERIRARVPQIAISCDVIVGFPGETDADFEETLDLAREVGFSRMHIFRYSARPGTLAAEMPDQVPPAVMAERAHRLRTLADELARADARRRIGTIERAVVERPGFGTLGSYHRVALAGVEVSAPALVDVAIMGVDETGLVEGRIVDAAPGEGDLDG